MQPTAPQLEILIAEDSAPVRSRLARWIDELPDVRVVGAVGTGPDAVRAWRELAPHVVVLDVALPGFDGLEVLRRIRESDHETVVLVITNHDEPAVREAAQQAHANGFFAKATEFEQMVAAIASLSPRRTGL